MSTLAPTGPASPPEARVHRRVAHVMGMPVSLAARGPYAAGHRLDQAWEQALEVLREADRVFSTWRPDSVVSRLGRGETTLAACPPEVHEVLELGEVARVESGGAFDVRRPTPRGPVLDPSGVVKGWAVQRAAAALDLPGTDTCLSAGGDLVCRTRAAGSAGWQIGVEDPHDPTRLVATIPVRDGAVATSGLAHRGDHVVDPRTGRVPRALASVTVVAADLTWADIDATAALALDADGPAWLRSRGRTGLVVHADGRRELITPTP